MNDNDNNIIITNPNRKAYIYLNWILILVPT